MGEGQRNSWLVGQSGHKGMLSHFSRVWLFEPEDCSSPGSCLQGFSRQEYWGGLPWPHPGDLPNPGIEQRSLHCRQIFFFLNQSQGSPQLLSSLPSYMSVVCGAPEQLEQWYQRSLITDNHKEYNFNEKLQNMVRVSKCDTVAWSEQMWLEKLYQ